MGNRRRRWLIGVLAAVVVVATAAIVYRVLAPDEVLTPARTPYPTPVAPAEPGVIGTLVPAPLILDGRLRVYAAARQVRADRPVDARTPHTPYWSYRRWPAQLTAVVAGDVTVVSRWSDGELVALDARTGRIAWRTAGPKPDQGYEGRRTGAATLYAPPGLHTGTARDGRSVLVVTGAGELRAYDLATGNELWRGDASCLTDGFTTDAGGFVAVDTCASPHAIRFHDLATGAATTWRPDGAGAQIEVEPVGCAIGRSECPAMRTTSAGSSRGWLLEPAGPLAAPSLDPPHARLVGDVALAVVPAADRGEARLVARSARTGAELWRLTVPAGTEVLAVQPGRAHLLTADRHLITVDATTGAELSAFSLAYGHDPTDWTPGFVDARYGFVAIERLAEPVDPAADDSRYYLDIQPVILART